MGRSQASEQEMRQALHTAAADFVWELKDGLDTACFEKGGGLSEGQAQRIAIARGLLRKGSILLMDEFSSALDSETEALLIQRLSEQMNGKTMIFITHREMITQYCDKILKLERK
jgi:ABC-type multidrug transport system fused ATPase/permease subunit